MQDILDLPVIDETAIAPAPAGPKTEIAVAAASAIDLAKLNLKDLVIAKFGPWRADVAAVKKNLSTLELDLSTQARVDEAKSLRQRLINQPIADGRKVSKFVRSKLSQAGRDASAEEDALVAAYEAAGNLITPKINEAQDRLDTEREARAEAERERVAKHEAGIATIRGYLQQAQGLTAMRIASGIALLEGMTFGEEWEEFVELAIAARDETLAALRKLHDDTLAAELRAVEEARIRKEHADQQQALQIGQKALALMGKPAGEVREQLNLLELTVYPEGTAAVVQQAHDSAVATLTTMLQLAEEREQRLAEEAAAKTKADEALAAMTPVAPPAVDPPAPTVGELQEQAADEPVAIHSTEYPEGRDSQQVLKAEALGPDATDREPPADASPSVGSMGAEQPADAGLAGEDESTMPAGSRGGVAIDMALSAADAGKVAEFIDAMTTTEALREALHLVEYLRGPFTGRFPTQPKPSTEWWAGLRTQLDSLQPRLHSALGIEVTP